MPRQSASVPPEAIRIEEEVWEEAFARREPARTRPRPRLHAIDGGGLVTTTVVTRSRRERPASTAPPPAAARRLEEPRAQPWQEAVALARPVTGAELGASAPESRGVPGRRTVTIRGYGAERNLPWPDASRRRPQRRAHERAGFRPDRVAMWAVLLGILLVIVAIASAHG